jgi:prefoldin subunit 5
MDWARPAVGTPPALSKEQELAALKQQAESIEQILGELKSRIQELDNTAPDIAAKNDA